MGHERPQLLGEPPNEDAVDRIAQAFHATYEELALEVGYITRPESRVPWDEVPAENRDLIRLTVRRLLWTGEIQP